MCERIEDEDTPETFNMKSGDTIRVSEMSMKQMSLPREPHEMTPEELLAIEISKIFVKEEINGHSWCPMSTTNVRATTKIPYMIVNYF